MTAPDGTVVPKPQIPKTLGILHLIFGTLLVLGGTCILGFTLAAPAIATQYQQVNEKQVQAIQDGYRAQLKTLEDAEQSATDEETKATLRDERTKLANSPPPKPIQADLSGLDQLGNPTIRNATVVEKLSGLALNIALIVAGVGLIRLRPWGRSLAIQVAAVQLVRIVAMTILYLTLVIPAQRAEAEKILDRLEQQVKAGNAPPTAQTTIQSTRMMLPLAPLWVVGYYPIAAIYPVVCLVLLRTRGARAAFDQRLALEDPQIGERP